MDSNTIVVGAAGPLSGKQKNYGAQIRYGVAYAVQKLNETGGLLGKRVTVQQEDDLGLPDCARVAAANIVNSGAPVVIGHYLSDCSSAAAETYASGSVLQIAPSSTNPQFTDDCAQRGSNTTFRTCGRDDKQGSVAADYIQKVYPHAKIAILHNNLPYGIGLTRVVRERLNETGLIEIIDASFDTSANSLRTIEARLREDAIDFVYVGAYYTELGPLIRFLRETGFKGQFMTGGANANKQLYDLAGEASDGLLMTCRPDARLASCARSAVAAIRALSFEPEGYTLSAVAAVEVWAEAVKRCGTIAAAIVAQTLKENAFSSSYGDLSFDAKGDVRSPLYAIHRWSQGQYSEISSQAVAAKNAGQ